VPPEEVPPAKDVKEKKDDKEKDGIVLCVCVNVLGMYNNILTL